MKFKRKLAITAAVSAALIASGCGQRQPRYDDSWQADDDVAICTDRSGNRVDDDYCDDDDYRGMGYVPFFIHRGGHVPGYGHKVNKRYGSWKARPGVRYSSYGQRASYKSSSSYRSSSTVSRGGFGSTGSSMSVSS